MDDVNSEYVHHPRYDGRAIIDWYALYREAFRCYKPADINMKCDDGSVSPGRAMHQWAHR